MRSRQPEQRWRDCSQRSQLKKDVLMFAPEFSLNLTAPTEASMIGNPLKIKDLISEMSQGNLRIPEIQRGYVWKRSQIAKLLDSIYRGFPTGSILLWDTVEAVIYKEMQTNLGRSGKSDFIPKIVLDGQQRLTSLSRVFDKSTEK